MEIKYQLRHGIKNLNYLIIFCIRYSRLFRVYYQKKHETVTVNPLITIYVNKNKKDYI